jgi:LytS/YehU family sensor histidine kinase
MENWYWGWILGAHLLIAPLYSWGTVEAYLGVLRMGAPPETIAALEARAPWLVLTHFTLYAIQFALYHLIRSLKRLRLKQQQASSLLTRAREQELAALKAQVNPHFLFNTLNSISATLKKDPDQAREMIAKLAGLMRYALDSSDQDRVPLRDEVHFAQRYLSLERHRFSDRLDATVEINAEDSALDTPVPPMVLQPLVENALRHGIAPSETGGCVSLTVSELEDRVRVCVTDTGVGSDTDHPLSPNDDGMGLSNTNARLKRTYGPDAALQTAPNDPTGFVVWFSLPRDGTPAP